MKVLLHRVVPAIIVFMLLTFTGYSQSDPFKTFSDAVNGHHKSKDKVVEEVICFDSTGVAAPVEYYLPKGKYVIYVMADTGSFAGVSFSLKGNSMEWETKDKDQRKIVSEGKGFKQKKWIISNPIKTGAQYGTLEFKVDDIMNLMRNAGARADARRQATINATNISRATRGEVTTSSASFTKYENGAELIVNLSADAADIRRPWGAVKIFIFER
ncbi:MAG: hypothetical protein J0M10_04955 [Chitinophagales bacterium]|nr:hypothetical protein [Chitinophagales bacterium]